MQIVTQNELAPAGAGHRKFKWMASHSMWRLTPLAAEKGRFQGKFSNGAERSHGLM